MIQDIYILGGEGFIGMNLAEFFGVREKYKVYIISKGKSRLTLPNNVNVVYIYNDIYKYNFKLNTNSIIIHLARSKFGDFNEFSLKEKKLKEYINYFNPKKIIIFSSSVCYTKGASLYKKEKNILEDIWNSGNLIVRLFNTYGRYQLPNRQGSLISTIFFNNLIGKITKINDINQVRNFIYAGDIGKVLEKYINNNILGIVDIGNETITIGTLLENIGKIISNNTIKILGNKEEIFLKEPKSINSITYTKLLDGLKETYSFLQENKNNL